jgi:phospholipid/cholesterol/gamma-HCH transport system permease protein
MKSDLECLLCGLKQVLNTMKLLNQSEKLTQDIKQHKLQIKKDTVFIADIGKNLIKNSKSFLNFVEFFGLVFVSTLKYIGSPKTIRFKEIFFEINESAIKAFWIISLTSFLIGLVVAYQSAFQLKLYGANIFVVDMLGISILRELAPLITAIVIAGRSGSAYTAQIGAMKITQELDAMKTMGFDPFAFLVLPRIIALMITMPILIFVSDMMGIFGGMIIANVDLAITAELFLSRFNEVININHFYIGIIKGPFFAFLIASIGIYRGMMVKDDTQSIGFNTTKSVVESIFAVIICDAVFSIALTNLGM